jgi:hypothetical protein
MFMYGEKSKHVREKWKMTLSLNVQFNGSALLKNVELFAKKMDCGSLPIHPAHLISHHPISFCSALSTDVSKK